MTKIIGVHFDKNGKLYYFDPRDFLPQKGDYVIVDTQNGPEVGLCRTGVIEVANAPAELKPMLRPADERDLQTLAAQRELEAPALKFAQQKANELELDMKVISADYSYDGGKITFCFVADERVDFRNLVRDLSSHFHKRIELRMVGARDHAQMLGGISHCGREFCCSSRKSDFHPVSIKMAKEQGLGLNPTKISGACGRLMCCLKHEHEGYAELQKTTPKFGARIDTPDGPGTVKDVKLLKQQVNVLMDEGENDYRLFSCEECCGCGKHKATKPIPKSNTDDNTPPPHTDNDKPRPRRNAQPKQPKPAANNEAATNNKKKRNRRWKPKNKENKQD